MYTKFYNVMLVSSNLIAKKEIDNQKVPFREIHKLFM